MTTEPLTCTICTPDHPDHGAFFHPSEAPVTLNQQHRTIPRALGNTYRCAACGRVRDEVSYYVVFDMYRELESTP